jgi:tripeptide aminopeptidase
MDVVQRFLSYAVLDTTSDDRSLSKPTTPGQLRLAKLLSEEMKEIGFSNVVLTEDGYVYGSLPAVSGYESQAHLGFVAHMDTAPDFSGNQVKPLLFRDYDGGDVPLGASGKSLKSEQFPHLSRLKGRCLITTDGTTLLGADNKAGIAEILTACTRVLEERIPHGKIGVAFTPDEEVGKGPDGFDLAVFDCDFAYTVDGGPEGEIEFENFNGCDAVFRINGYNVHPGSAKNLMVNAAAVASEIHSQLPIGETPRNTEGYEGFFHLTRMEGTVESATLEYIVRDHDRVLFESRKEKLRSITATMNRTYGEDTVVLTITDRYANMAEMVRPHYHLIDNAVSAVRSVGLEPIIKPIRGGTDGARLSFMGLPCPNLGTGGYGYHGPYEHITAEGMELTVDILVELIRIYSNRQKE